MRDQIDTALSMQPTKIDNDNDLQDNTMSPVEAKVYRGVRDRYTLKKTDQLDSAYNLTNLPSKSN